MSEWQPIESCPIDEWVLIAEERDSHGLRVYPVKADRWGPEEGQISYEGPYADGYMTDLDFEPTHWMPLPDPPAAAPPSGRRGSDPLSRPRRTAPAR